MFVPFMEGDGSIIGAYVDPRLGRFAEAREALAQRRSIYAVVGLAEKYAETFRVGGQLELLAKDPAAEREIREALRLYAEMGARWVRAGYTTAAQDLPGGSRSLACRASALGHGPSGSALWFSGGRGAHTAGLLPVCHAGGRGFTSLLFPNPQTERFDRARRATRHGRPRASCRCLPPCG
jgi:hypothetical protein